MTGLSSPRPCTRERQDVRDRGAGWTVVYPGVQGGDYPGPVLPYYTSPGTHHHRVLYVTHVQQGVITGQSYPPTGGREDHWAELPTHGRKERPLGRVIHPREEGSTLGRVIHPREEGSTLGRVVHSRRRSSTLGRVIPPRSRSSTLGRVIFPGLLRARE